MDLDQELQSLPPFPSLGKEEHEKILRGVQCELHHCKITDCFEKHHDPEPILKIVLPCGHLIDRPTKATVVVTCECGDRFRLMYNTANTWESTKLC